MNPVRVGVIGIGNMGWHHARVLSLLRDAELVGVADPDELRGQLATEQFGCRWFADYATLLGEVEAVCVAVPTLLHHRVGLAALQAGVDVLIEKPIAATQEEANDLIRAAETAGRLLQVGHIERFNPAFRELLKVVAGEEVVVLEARRHSPNPDRANDVSVVLDLMIHDIDLLYTHCRSSLMETDFLKHNLRIHRRPHTTVSADHGELVYRNDGFIEEVSTTSIEPLYAELEHFLQCVRGVEKPAVDGLQASRALLLADLIEQCVERPNLCMTLDEPI